MKSKTSCSKNGHIINKTILGNIILANLGHISLVLAPGDTC